MTQILHVQQAANADVNISPVIIGEHAFAYLQKLSHLSDTEQQNVCNEAVDILSRCIPADKEGSITNLAVGYVQSGKTMSFTMLTALAADNGYKMIIYLTGTKLNLQDQTAKRLKSDLGINIDNEDYVLLDETIDPRRLSLFLQFPNNVVLIPIMKHHKHINDLVHILNDTTVKAFLNGKGVIIIDDEADQASLNTLALKNSRRDAGEEEELSKTYEAITNLKQSISNHSYIQYTATPQSLILIDENDILSPTYHTVLTPGNGYVGGKHFFKENASCHIRMIPEEEVETKSNILEECPKTLVDAVMFFFLSVIYKVYIKKSESYLSMMVHIDGRQDTNIKYHGWINQILSRWYYLITDPSGTEYLMNEFQDAYTELCTSVPDAPSLVDFFRYFASTLGWTSVHLLQSNAANNVNWESAKGHIIVGANMLNRGFTIEKLSTTFMPRTNKSIANADTIEQRCRFFGYKKNYIEVCRIYLSQKAKEEFEEYVEHEEILRTSLKQCNTIKEFKSLAKSLILSPILNATRKNVLSDEYVKDNLSGWQQYCTVDFASNNLQMFVDFINNYQEQFILDRVFNLRMRNHRYVDISLSETIQLLSKFATYDVLLRNKKTATIQYLRYMMDNNSDLKVRVYHMSYQEVRSRSLTERNVPKNLLMGPTPDGRCPSDRDYKCDDFLTIQLHHIKINDNLHRAQYQNLETCNMAIYYPENSEFSFYNF